MFRFCKNNKNLFCLICGIYCPEKCRVSLNTNLMEIFEKHFSRKFPSNSWTPETICTTCHRILYGWNKGDNRDFSFTSPMTWLRAADHDNCYFCQANIDGLSSKTRQLFQKPDVSSVVHPVFHKDSNLPEAAPMDSSYESDHADHEVSKDDDFILDVSLDPVKFNQEELNDLIRSLKLTKQDAELLASRLKERNMLVKDVKISFYRSREEEFRGYFESEGGLTYCKDVMSLLSYLNLPTEINKYRLFLDADEDTFKAVLLQEGNKSPPLIIGFSSRLRESYDVSLIY